MRDSISVYKGICLEWPIIESSTCGQIKPIVQKLEEHFTMKHEDTMFVASIKEKVRENLSLRYQDEDIQAFLHLKGSW